MTIALVLTAALALGVPAALPFWHRGRLELALAVLPFAGALSILLPVVAAPWVAVGLSGWGWQALVASLLLGVGAAAALGGEPEVAAPPPLPVSRLAVPAALLLLAVLAYTFWLTRVLSTGWPGFGWDGLAIWLVRAKVLAASDVFPAAFFREAELRQGHWDYPLLFPAWLAWFERMGSLPVHRLSIPLGLAAAVFPLATVLGLSRCLSLPIAAAVGISPLAVPELLDYHFRGYADPLLAMTGLAGLAWCAAGAIRWDRPSLVAGGLALAAAVSVKNEGFLWLCATGVGLVLLSAQHRLPARAWLGGLARALLPGLLLFAVWRLTCAHLEVEGTLLSALRWDLVAQRFGPLVAAMGQHVFTPQIGPFLVACTIGMLALARGSAADRLLVTAALLSAPLAFVAGLCLIYLATPHEMAWHIQTSLHRTVYPLGPAVFALAALTGALSREIRPDSPEDLASSS